MAGKGKVGIESLGVSTFFIAFLQERWPRRRAQAGLLDQVKGEGFLSRFLTVAHRQRLVDPHRFMANGRD